MPATQVERRRWRRSVVPAGQDEGLMVVWSHTVRILDISVTGAMVQATSRLSIGEHAVLRTTLAGQPFEVGAQVRHVEPMSVSAKGSPIRMGLAFVDGDERNRTIINRFLSV
jgi:hypothetical protein